MITLAVFALFAAMSVACGLLMITRKNPMHSVLYLAFTVLSIGGVFFSMAADFIGAIQIMVYAGGIVVLYIFVIIIINLNQIKEGARGLFPKLFLIAVPLLLAVELIYVLMRRPLVVPSGTASADDLPTLSAELLSTYLIPFEVASVLLLAVLIGSVIIARKKVSHDSN